MSNDDLISTITVTDPKIAAHLRLIDKGIKQQNEKIAKQLTRIAELETQVDYFKDLLGEEEAQLARYRCVGIVANTVGTGVLEGEIIPKAMLDFSSCNLPEGTKLFALKDEK